MSPLRLIPLLAAAIPLAATSQIVINEIAAATSERLVRYDDSGAPKLGSGLQWHHPSFDDSGWLEGNTPIGTSGASTLVTRENVSLYARTSFTATAEEAGSASAITINITYDDGYIAYLNGREIGRSNLGPPLALAYHDQSAYNPNPTNSTTLTLPSASAWLTEGENTLSIQVHASGESGNANIRLDASLSLASPSSTLVARGAGWLYLPGTAEPSAGLYDRPVLPSPEIPPGDPNWKVPSFDNSLWPTTHLPVGYDSTPDYPVAKNLLNEMRGNATSLYLIASFELTPPDLDAITSLTLTTDFDDGIALYLNGPETARYLIDAGAPFTSTANSSHGARFDNGGDSPQALATNFPSLSLLKVGRNVLAAQVHNQEINSTDLFASLTLVANGLGRRLVADGHPVSYFVGTEAPSSRPTDPVAEPESGTAKVSDWIELHNPTAEPIDLSGWSLTDSPSNLDEWTFPEVTIPPAGFLTVLASGRDRRDPSLPLQTSFKLSTAGEFLALVRPDASIADSLGESYPPQSYFHSYGRDQSGSLGYFTLSTPGTPNPTTNLTSILQAPQADLPTGHYPQPVAVTLSTTSPGATVRYTTDGTEPSETNGLTYTSPVPSNNTTEFVGEPGKVLREVWTGITGTSVSDIPVDSPPNSSSNSFSLSAPPDWGRNYGDRYRGYLLPAVSGDYLFWIASGDSSELWLSTDDTSSQRRLIASVPSRTGSREWDKFPSQSSAPIHLEAGTSYYFEALRKAGTGTDHLAVAWQPPGGSLEVPSGASMAPVVVPQTPFGTTSLTLKARTFAPGHVPSPVTTRSYLINHSSQFADTPTLLVSGDPGRSLFAPNGATAIVGGTNAGTWSATDPTTDYNMATAEGRPYERPIVLEYLEPGGALGFRNGAAVRIAGSPHARPRYNFTDLQNNNWLGSWTQKPSLNFFFRDELGTASIDYPLFGENRVSTFGDLRLRAGKNDSSNPFIRDEVMRRLSAATGQPASRGSFVNLFINGQYKAYFNLTERLRERFFQEHYNSSDGWDIWHIREIVEGDRTHYDETMNLLRTGNFSNAASYAAAAARVDLTSYIDYIIVNAYGATGDWPHNNYNLARERSPSGKWKFSVWDAEGAFGAFGHDINWNTLTSDLANGPTGHMTSLVYRSLRTNPEFRTLFADRIQKHFFDDGGLTQDSIRNIYLETRDEFAPVLRAARGQNINESFFNNWWPSRRNILFGHFQSEGMWSNIQPPGFSLPPGEIAAGATLALGSPTGTIHYTTDGSDPRAVGGSVAGLSYDSPIPITKSTLVKARTQLPNGDWSPLREILYTTPEPPLLVISEIHYNPDGPDTLEFIELKNTGTTPIDLTALYFSDGITFTFPDGTLQPGSLLVLVKDPGAFSTAFPGISVAGTFTGSLDNAGERLTLTEPGGRTVFSVRYNDKAPWPTGADGDGLSLILTGTAAESDSPDAWSSAPASPGTEPISTFSAWQSAHFAPGQLAAALDDPDLDLIPNLVEYALGLSPHTPDTSPLTPFDHGIAYTTYPPASDVTVTLFTSTDLATWVPLEPDTTTANNGGTLTHTSSRLAAGAYFRLSVTLAP